MDRELLIKASKSAQVLVDDLQAIYVEATNPLLPDMVAEMLAQARRMADNLARLAMLCGPEFVPGPGMVWVYNPDESGKFVDLPGRISTEPGVVIEIDSPV